MAVPHPQGLYDPSQERDACGVAFVADLHGRRCHDVVAKGLSALIRLDHRGARGAEYNTGDGAGILIQVPDRLYREIAGVQLPPAGPFAPGLAVRPRGEDDPTRPEKILEKDALVVGGAVRGWRG
ncbi:hypothetical protein AB0M20_31200, partial [Actinoplanes sp. NPDC051633]|uniref:hypothetical protein n=1 Tax=Actinoplanes sp. NPDC051633 TaxID=3155670 RepID=UPI00342931F6